MTLSPKPTWIYEQLLQRELSNADGPELGDVVLRGTRVSLLLAAMSTDEYAPLPPSPAGVRPRPDSESE